MTSIEWLIGRFHFEGFIGTYCDEEQIKSKRQLMIEIIEQAKEMEIKQSHDYAEFAIRCDRLDMKILNFDGYINLENTNK